MVGLTHFVDRLPTDSTVLKHRQLHAFDDVPTYGSGTSLGKTVARSSII